MVGLPMMFQVEPEGAVIVTSLPPSTKMWATITSSVNFPEGTLITSEVTAPGAAVAKPLGETKVGAAAYATLTCVKKEDAARSKATT